MMPIIGLPVKLSCLLGFDISLMAVIERIQEEKYLIYFAFRNITLFLHCCIFCVSCFQRVKAGILKAFNNPTEKTADEDTKRQVKGSYTCCSR